VVDADITGRLIDHLRDRRAMLRDSAAREATELHLLDTMAAVISGRVMPAGEAAAGWLRHRPTVGQSSCAGDEALRHTEEAAFVNAICAHADESDDSHEASRSHPGASIVPVALAVAEDRGSGPDQLLDAIALGYEACALMNWLFWPTGEVRRRAHGSPHAMGGLWGSAVAAATLCEFDDDEMRSLISYTAQLAGGLGTWLRDEHHIEKAFVFSGMPAWNAVRAAGLVNSGWPGVRDTLDGTTSFFSAFGVQAELSAFDRACSGPPVVLETNIKKYCVGSPAQAAVQAAEELADLGVTADQVSALRIHLPLDLARIVDQRDMSNINVQYLVARTLIDGRCTFAAAHDNAGSDRTDVAALLKRTELVAEPDMEPVRQARVEIEQINGPAMSRAVFPVRGTKDDPMSRAEVEAKADDLMSMALPSERRAEMIAACRSLDDTSIERLGAALRRAQPTGVQSGDSAVNAL
jgi:2-methylcitrate dehydratase PrpD